MGNSVIESRKKDHVDFVVREGAQYSKSSGFDQYDFVHNSLPELAFDKINLSMKFFGKKLSAPMIITGMTGGYASAERINHDLASVAQKYGIAFGLGSQRAMIETPSAVYCAGHIAKRMAEFAEGLIEGISPLLFGRGKDFLGELMAKPAAAKSPRQPDK